MKRRKNFMLNSTLHKNESSTIITKIFPKPKFELIKVKSIIIMLRADKEKVYIEHCINCKSHTWCTNHDEEKYKEYFTRCQSSISRTCYNVTVVENMIPEGFTSHFITDPNTSKPGKFHFPRIGSFEVYFRGAVIFSKIESMKWPHASKIAEKIKEIQDTPPAEANRKKKLKPKRIKSALLTKKKKIKKSKKKLNRKKIADTENIPNSELMLKNSEKPRKNFEEIFKNRSSSLDSSSENKNSDSEQPVPPYDYYQYQTKAKTPPRVLDSFGRVEDMNLPPQPKVVESAEKKTEVKSNVRQVAKVEIPSSKSSKSSNTSRGRHIEQSSDEYESESYESNPDIENINLDGHLIRNDGQKVVLQSSAYSDQEYRSEDYEKYQSSSESDSEEKGQKNGGPKDKNVVIANGSSSAVKLKKSKSSSSSDYEKDYQDDYEKSSKSSHSKKSSEGDYDQDFEDNQDSSERHEDSIKDQNHPLRPVDKSFPVSLFLGEECRKKISYENTSPSEALFTIKSSDPDLMSIKNEEILIKPSQKDKIQLSFAPLLNECEKKFYLYINKNNSPWECIEIVAQYE